MFSEAPSLLKLQLQGPLEEQKLTTYKLLVKLVQVSGNDWQLILNKGFEMDQVYFGLLKASNQVTTDYGHSFNIRLLL